MQEQLRQVACDYYALCDRAEKIGVPTSLDNPRSPRTVAALKTAVKTAESEASHAR